MQPNMTAQQPPALAPGVMLRNRYLIEGYIGGGGFGHIYRARDTALGHLRAIKEAFYQDQNSRRQFQLEAEFLLNARHPNLVRGYSVFESHGRLYLVMDYVDGQTLEDIAIDAIKRTHLPPAEAQVLDWILPICDALTELHSQPTPIIHRDVKPANIKLSATYSAPVLIDLGLAKLYNRGQQTIAAALAFTPGYAPPEQYQASGATDQRTDIYGLGATLYYLLTGYQPVEAPARLSAHALPTPRERNPQLTQEVNDIVLKAMSLDPNVRYQNAREISRALSLHRASLDGVAYEMAAMAQYGGACSRCGAYSPPVANYCMRCGAALYAHVPPANQSAPAAAPSAEPQPAAFPQRLPQPAAPYPQLPPVRELTPLRPPVFARAAAVAATAPAYPYGVDAFPLTLPGWLGQFQELPAPSQREAYVSLAAFLSVIAATLSLTAPIILPMLVFAPIALALAIWSLTQTQFTDTPTPAPREFRWLAWAGLALSVACLFGWSIHLALLIPR